MLAATPCAPVSIIMSFLGWRPALASVCLLCVSSPAVIAQALSVELHGAGDMEALLRQNLTITQLAPGDGAGSDELQRLVRLTPQQITDLLATEGYFSPQVSGHLTKIDGRLIARFDIQPGEPVTISEVRLAFHGEIATRDPQRIAALRERWLLKRGERFRQSQWTAAKTDLLGAVLAADYPAARLTDSDAIIDPASGSAKLQLSIDSGPAFTFGTLQVRGLERYPMALVTNANLIRPGEPYSQARLSELQARVLGTGYFRSVFTSIDADPAQPQRVPVRVEVAEQPRKRVGIGAGVSTDSGARLQLKYTDRLFLDRDWRLESVFRVDRQSLLAQGALYFQPLQQALLFGQFDGWIPSVLLGLERTVITGQEVERIRNSVRLSTPSRINERVVSLSLLADRPTIPDAELPVRRALVAGYTLTRRLFDQLLAPTRGYSASIALSAGVGGALNDVQIARIFVNGVWLHPLSDRWTAVARAQAGEIFGAGTDKVPEDLLFRTGGDQTVRGYAFGSLGVPRNGVTIGGNVLAVASAELQYRITPQWGAAVFHDIGDAARFWSDFRARRGVGVGARWRSPIGAVNIDVARGIESGDTRLHFSVGYGF